jgi:hypothetical protein
MARNIGIKPDRVYRAVTKYRQLTQGVVTGIAVKTEGIYDKASTAKARLTFWKKHFGPENHVDGWVMESGPITWHRLGEEPPTPPAPVSGDRGFLTYGNPIETDYGHDLRLYESSAATGPHTWLDLTETDREPVSPSALAGEPHLGLDMLGSPTVEFTTAHLSLAQAIMLRNALGQFIDGVPERWEGGQKLLEAAYREVAELYKQASAS